MSAPPFARRIPHALFVLLLLGPAGCGDDPSPRPATDVDARTDTSDDAGDAEDAEPTPDGTDDVAADAEDTPAPDDADVAPDIDTGDAEDADTEPPEDPWAEIDRLGELLRDDDERALEVEARAGLYVGYGERDLAWRAGAKPGQVGTAALPARDELLAGAVGEILRILRGRDFAVLLQEITAWQLGRLEQTTEGLEHGVYHRLFEPGRGVELPPAVNAVVVSRGDEHVAIVSADLYLPHEQFHRRVAHLVAERTGIHRDRLFLGATHNHSAPHSVSTAVGIWTFGDQFDFRHWVYMTHRVADAIVEAWENREPAQVRTARTTFSDVQMNINSAGTAELAPAPGEPRETIPTGYPRGWYEDDLVLVRFDTLDDAPIAQLFVLGMHPETMRDNHGIITGEFPRHAERKIRERTGAPTIWLSGALGDVEPDREHNTPGANYWRGGWEPMHRMTDAIADAVTALRDSTDAQAGDPDPVVLNLARDFYGPEVQRLPRSTYLGPDLPMVRLIHDSIRIRIHLVRIADVLLVGTPGEIPTDMSLNLKSRMETGSTPEAVFQGFVPEGAAAWVEERIEANFDTDVASEDAQVPIVAVISLVNSYVGYVVTRWEFENRAHYRQSLTCFGPDTAEFMNRLAIDLNEELHGGAEAAPDAPEFSVDDRRGFDQMTLWLRELDARVPPLARTFPVGDPDTVGQLLAAPAWFDADPERLDGFPDRVETSWRGGTNDVDLPRVVVEQLDEGVWQPVAEGPGPDVFVLFEAPDVWTASWRSPGSGAEIRFRIEGVWRSAEPGTSEPDPLWDPDGANAPYTLTTDAWTVPVRDR